MPSSRVLLATDFSPGSADAAAAARLVAERSSDVTALHVAPVGTPGAAAAGQPPANVAPGRSRLLPPAPGLAQARSELSAWCDAHGLEDAERLVEAGEPGTRLLSLAATLDPWMVVLGATGRGRLSRALLGTTATRVAHEAPCDVLVARARGGEVGFRRILLAVDFSPHSVAAAAEARRVARRCGGRLTLLHVRDHTLAGAAIDPGAAEPRLVGFRDRHAGGDADLLLREGSPAGVVRDVAEEIGADLVVAGNRGTSNLTRMVIGSVARSILERAPCSVLLTRREAERRTGENA